LAVKYNVAQYKYKIGENMTVEQSVIITPGQARALIALQFEREEIVRRINKQMEEIAEAVQEQGHMLSLLYQLPIGKNITYRFDSVTVDDEMRIRLTAVEAPAEEVAEPVESTEIVESTE